MKNTQFEFFNEVLNNTRLTILEHGYLKTDKEWNFESISSPFNRIYFIVNGKGQVKNKENNLYLLKENACIIPLHNKYDYICNDKLEKFYIHFRMEFYHGHDLFENCSHCESIPVSYDEIMELVHCAQSGKLNDLIKCKGLLLIYISRFIKPYSSEIKQQIMLSSKYSLLYDYIRENCFADLRVKNIARELNTSVSNLSKQFKNDMGVTLKKYIDDRIIQKAQELLLLNDASIKDTASQLRFLDEFHFSRFFKNYVGLSPSKYRQRNNSFK